MLGCLGTAEKWKQFSTAEHLAGEAGDGWELVKTQGNEALAQGEHTKAAELYEQAAMLAVDGPAVLTQAFVRALETWPAGSPQRDLADHDDIERNIAGRLPGARPPRRMALPTGGEWVAAYPNKGAGIAWANQAQALLLAGLPDKALVSAEKAIQANPEYVKAHHRKLKALQALGQRQAAAEIQQEICEYQLAREMYPAETIALLSAGWINWERHALIYTPARFGEAASALEASLAGDERKIELRASVVPFQGGQGLMLTVARTDWRSAVVECIEFAMADHENADLADAPPNGHASEKALKNIPILIAKCISDLEDYHLVTVAIMCGQGLTEHVQLLRDKLRAGGDTLGGFHGPMPNIRVYRASSTHASEEAGLPPSPDFDAVMEMLNQAEH